MSFAPYVSLLVIFLPFSSVAVAQQVSAADRTAITQCLSKAQTTKGNSETCVGVVADPCISGAKSNDSYDKDTKACAARELAVWNERLNASLKALKASGFPALPAALPASQANWQKSRDAMCALFDKIDPGMYLGGSVYCALHETGHRELMLENLVAAVSEH